MSIPDLNNILYVEDDVSIQKIAQMALERIGKFDVKICSSGREAMECVCEYNPDLFLLDVMMPDMDGPTTLTELRKIDKFSNTPAIFMTAKVQSHEIAGYKDMGAMEVIIKPFNAAVLSSQIREIWRKYHE